MCLLSVYVCVCVYNCVMCVSVCVIAVLPRLLPPLSHQECEGLASHSARRQIPGIQEEKQRETGFWHFNLCILTGAGP